MGTQNAQVGHNAEHLAKQYLIIEFKKIFSDVDDAKFFEQMESSIQSLDQRFNRSSFWGLLAGISEGLRLNAVHEILTNNSFGWSLEDLSIDEHIVLTGMGPELDHITHDLCQQNPLILRQKWQTDPQIQEVFRRYDINTSLKDDYPPIFVYDQKDEGKFSVFDGIHRVIAATLSDNMTIKAWVGRLVNPAGKPSVNGATAFTLMRIFKRSQHQEEVVFRDALARIVREAIEIYDNGRAAFITRIIDQSRNQSFQDIFKDL